MSGNKGAVRSKDRPFYKRGPMSSSKLQICNLALSALGVENIAALTDQCEAARKLEQIFEPQRDEVLRAHDWNFANKVEALALIAGETSPGYDYVYTYPARCLYLRKLLTEDGEPAVPVKFEEVLASNNLKGIATNQPDAWAKYTYQTQDPTFFDPIFVGALSSKLASELAIPLTGKPEIKNAMLNDYARKIEEAKLSNKSEVNPQKEQTSSFEAAR